MLQSLKEIDLFTRLILTVSLLALCVAAQPKDDAVNLLKESGLSGGIVVVLDNADGEFIADLATGDRFLVQALLTDEADVESVRQAIRARGLYGRASCNQYNGTELPYIDDLINLVLRSADTKAPREELLRVVAPGGMLMVETANGWQKTVKPWPDGMDEWNQFLHGADNNGVSLDNVGSPQRLRWHDTPEIGRSKALSPSTTNMVSAAGVVFTIEDWATVEDVNAPVEYQLVARDAFNGMRLWERPLKGWDQWQTNSIKAISTQQQRGLAAVGDRVYCLLEFGGQVTVLSARTGEQLAVWDRTEKTREFAIEGDTFYGIKGEPFGVGEGANYKKVKLYARALDTGALKWSMMITDEYIGGTLSINGERLAYCSASGLTCLRSTDGEVVWTQSLRDEIARFGVGSGKKPVSKKKKPTVAEKTTGSGFCNNIHPTVVMTGDMVHVAVGSGIVAKGLKTGATAWTADNEENYMKSPDLFVAGGLVWGRALQGHDPRTGNVVTRIGQAVTGPMSHDRCYRNRITHRYYLNSASGGTDFLKLDGKVERPNPWARSTCGLAVMPANGMIYNGPYVCQCAIGAMITGFNAMYSGVGNTDERFAVALTPRVVKGPVFGFSGGPAATAEDWPTYRGSRARGSVTSASPPRQLARKWKASVGPTPTAPVVAGDAVYVASRETHTLVALDRTSGEQRWSFTADGRVDSPPTYYKGLLVFGSRGGWVYCLRADDGRLVWKFNGLPERRLICDGGQLESAWPVNGSVMARQDTFYFSAGRSSFLDGGIAVFGLDPFSGRMKHGRMLQGPYQDDDRNFPIDAAGQFQLEGFKSGIFSSADDMLFIRHQAFETDLTPVKPDDVKALHLMASPGFLNACPQHRTYWTVDQNLRYGGPTGTFGAGPAGDVIAFDGKRFYEVRGYAPGRNLPGRGRDMNPLSTYSIFAGGLAAKGEKGAWSAGRTTIPGAGSWKEHWSVPTPFAGHAIAASRTTVLAVGVPMTEGYTQKDTNASFAGRKGGVAWLLDATDGRKLQELNLEAPPAWDGAAIARDQYFICLKDGSLVCLSGS